LAIGAETVWTPTNGKNLFVTDLVFFNPDPTRTGTVLLRRPSRVLFELRLASFRDLDYHFVTPITFRPGETMSLECVPDDDEVCRGAAVYFSGYER
jgi:hypothetical protein